MYSIDILNQGLATSSFSSPLKQPGLNRLNGKGPLGITLVPWKGGMPSMWDATCMDTFTKTEALKETRAAAKINQRPLFLYIFSRDYGQICL